MPLPTLYLTTFLGIVCVPWNAPWNAISAIQSLAVDLGINTELPDFISELYQRAAAAGYAEQDNASLIKVFRGIN